MSDIWDNGRHPEWFKNSSSSSMRFAGSCRSLFSRLVQRFQFVCYTCQMSHNDAKGYTSSKKNTWRKDIEKISSTYNKTQSFSGPFTSSKCKYTWKATLVPSSTIQKSVPLEFDNPPLNYDWDHLRMSRYNSFRPQFILFWLENKAMICILIHTPLF